MTDPVVYGVALIISASLYFILFGTLLALLSEWIYERLGISRIDWFCGLINLLLLLSLLGVYSLLFCYIIDPWLRS